MTDWDVLHSSEDMDWRTPPELFKQLDREFRFTLDAASSCDNALCSTYLTPQDDAIQTGWWRVQTTQPGPPTVWLNPPYGRSVGIWVDKAIEEAQRGCTVVMLTMACTDTQWWARAWRAAHEVRFITGRVHFLNSEGERANAAPKGSAIIVLRPSPTNPIKLVRLTQIVP